MYYYITNKIKKDKRYYYTFLILFFIFLSFLALSPFWITGHLYSGADLQFHTSRIQEIVENIKHGVLIPGVATHTFNQVGDMVVSSYPWVTLYPFALLMFIFNPINAIYLGMSFYIFLTLIISYYSMHLINNSRKISFYFAILYGYTSFFIFNTLNFEFGTFLSYAFFPLAIVGLYLVMFQNYKKWYLLTLGIVGVMYSHAPSTLILFCTLLALFFFFITFQKRKNQLKRFFYLIISGITTLILSLIVWSNIIILLLHQAIDKPQPEILTKGAIDIGSIFLDTFTNFSNACFNSGIGIGILASFIFGWYFINKVPKIAKIMYQIGIIILFIISMVFPWYIIHYIPILNKIESIQLMNRVLPIAILFIAGFGAYLLNWMNHQPNFYKEISRISIILIVFFNWFGGMSFIHRQSNIANKGLQSEIELNYRSDYGHQVPKTNIGFPVENYKVNSKEYYNQFGDEDASGITDYYPINASGNNTGSIAFHNLNYDKKFISLNNRYLKADPNSITYNVPIQLKNEQHIDLPFLYYNGFKYQVTINNKKVKLFKSNQRNTVSFKMPFTTQHPIIQVNYLGNKLNYILQLISIISWILLVGYIICINHKTKSEKKDTKND